MNRSARWLTVTLLLTLVFLGGLLWHVSRKLSATQAELAEIRTQAGSSQNRSAVSSQTIERILKPTATTIDPAPIVHTHSSAPASLAPQIVAQMKRQDRWRKLARKAEMFEELKLPNDRLAKFKELLIERDYAESDARSAARQVGIDPASATATEAAANAVNKIDDQIKTLLGTADFERYTELVGLDLFRANVAQSTIEGYLLDNGSPLAPQQSKSLAQAFYREFLNQSREPNRRTMETAASAGLTPSQRSIVDQARQFLTTEQIEALQNFFIGDNELGALIAASTTRNSP